MLFFKEVMSISKGAQLAWKHAQASGGHKRPANIMKNTLEIFMGKKVMNPHFQSTCVTSHQLASTLRGTNSSQETSQKPPETPDTRECFSVTLCIFLKDITEWNWPVGMGRTMAVLTPRTYTCSIWYWIWQDKQTSCPYSHLSWSTPCVVPLSWFWWHHKVQSKGEADYRKGRQISATWNQVYNTSKVT